MPPRIPEIQGRFRNTHRLVPSRYPPVGIFDAVADAEDLDVIMELEGWTNDRITSELGILRRLPKEEYVVGVTMASVIMAAFCHPAPGGSRFNDGDRGAWYAARALTTAHAEVIYHRSQEFAEIGVSDSEVQMREYLADFSNTFHDLRADVPGYRPFYRPDSYAPGQALAKSLLEQGANGVVYRSVRDPGGECIACFRPRLVKNVRQGRHFIYRWHYGEPVRIRTVRKEH